MEIATKTIEKIFERKVVPFISVMGVDTASRTGWCKITTNPKYITLDYSFIDIQTKNKYHKYNQYIDIFFSLLSQNTDIIIIEETYYGKNVKTFQLLSRLGGLVYAVAHKLGIKEKSFILAVSARKALGFKGNIKKAIIHKQFIKKMNLKLNDEDVIDAMILALTGIFEEEK